MDTNTQKGMWKRTIGIFRNIKIPWPLYLLEVILGIISTKVALLYIPYEADLKLGNIEDPKVVWGYIGFLLLASVMTIASRIPSFYAEAIVERNLQDKLIHRSVHLPMKYFESHASKIVSWITQDCSFANGLLSAIIGFITGMVSTYMSVTTMSDIDTTMLYIVPFIFVYVLFSTWMEGKLLFLRQRRERTADAELTAYLSEHLSFITQIKQLHSQKEEAQRGQEAIRKFYNAEIYQAILTLVNGFVSGSLTNIITILVFLLGVPKVKDGSITINELAAFQSYILIVYQSFSSLPGIYTDFMYYNGQLFYIAALMDKKEEVYQRKRSMDREDQDICFDHVTFGYGKEATIKDVSFTIPKGKMTVIVGTNGSGKTTLFKLLERFYTPDQGKVLFGSDDAESIHLQEWRQSMAYVLQEAQLFNGTIRDNINYGMDRMVAQEETESATKVACAHEFIRELPGGYDYVIGENGCKLSAGQRQRIAIARAIMLDPAYLLLDEATCNMDVQCEKSVTEALMKLMEHRTTVMITHDMKLLDRADHIIVLKDGCVEAEGTRDETEANSPTLRQLKVASSGS